MIIQHNIMALNSYNKLSTNNSLVSKNIEKLSSGYKINRAGDDAAGLAISEKMRAQITGLERATQNAQDGISLVQTAEGNLTEVHSMLNRMVDLSTQSSNGTYDVGVDRKNLQLEIQSLKDEIDRIAETSNFNGIKLLDGSLGGGGGASSAGVKGAVISADPLISSAVSVSEAVAGKYTIAAADSTKAGKYSLTYQDASGAAKTVEIDISATGKTSADFKTALEKTELGQLFTITNTTGASGTLVFENKVKGEGQAKIMMASNTGPATATSAVATVTTASADAYMKLDVTAMRAYKTDGSVDIGKSVITVNGQKFGFAFDAAAKKEMEAQGITTLTATAATPAAADATALINAINIKLGGTPAAVDGTTTTQINFKAQAGAASSSGGGLSLQIGDTADQRVTVDIDNMGVAALGLGAVDVSTESAATASMQVVKDAINTVSTQRAKLGAVQNRLEHTVNNLTTTAENMTSAEARIRDTDMAKEMMQFTKNNVLAQAAQAMLAQANQQPQQVLQLLR